MSGDRDVRLSRPGISLFIAMRGPLLCAAPCRPPLSITRPRALRAAIRAEILPGSRERQLVASQTVPWALGSGSLAFARGVEVPVDGGAGNAEEVCDLLDGALPAVVDLLSERDLLGVEPRSASALRPPARAAASPSRVLATISSRWSSARTESIPNIARPAAVVVSMPCSITCRPTPRSRSSAPSVTRCRTERPIRSRRMFDGCAPAPLGTGRVSRGAVLRGFQTGA
jgi:hypothetical protein